MAVYNKIADWVENVQEGVNVGSDQFTIALSNTAPASETTPPTGDGAGVLANVTEIAYTNLSTRNVTTASSAQTGGTHKLVLTDLVLTASGAVAAFRYVYLVDDTPTSPADPIAGYYDYGSSVTLANGETFTVDFDGTNGATSLT